MSGWKRNARKRPSTAAIGSMAPDKVPYMKAFPLLPVSLKNGKATTAPSGMFWMPIPIASISAPISMDEALPSPIATAAKATP